MSAIWTRDVLPVDSPVKMSRLLELRTAPHLFTTEVRDFESAYYLDTIRGKRFKGLYESSFQSWLYGAAMELSQTNPTPSWSKDTWSFVPVSINASLIRGGSWSELAKQRFNTTIVTPAVRARLECHPTEVMSNTSRWLTEIDFRMESNAENKLDIDYQGIWNATNSPPGLARGYILKGLAGLSSRYGSLICCANETDGIPGEVAIGYWSNRELAGGITYDKDQKNMLDARWVVGRPLEFNTTWQPYAKDAKALWIWPEEPRLLMVNCTPVIEQAQAKVVLEAGTGIVHDYHVLSEPQIVTDAWSDNFLVHGISVDYTGGYTWNAHGNMSVEYNVTARSVLKSLYKTCMALK